MGAKQCKQYKPHNQYKQYSQDQQYKVYKQHQQYTHHVGRLSSQDGHQDRRPLDCPHLHHVLLVHAPPHTPNHPPLCLNQHPLGSLFPCTAGWHIFTLAATCRAYTTISPRAHLYSCLQV